MTTLVTGAGMLGSLVAARLVRDRGERPVLYDVAFSRQNLAERLDLDDVELVAGDVTDVPELIAAIRDHGVNRIVHTASLLTSTVKTRPYAGTRINFLGTVSVLEAARLAGVHRVVFCSSSTVALGRAEVDAQEPMPADFPLRTVSEYPPSLYATLKLACEWVCHTYTAEHDMDCLVVRFAGVFGPWHGSPGGGPSKLFKQLVESACLGQPIRLARRDIEQPGRDYTYAPDGAQALAAAAYVEAPHERVFHASMGELRTLPQILRDLENYVGRPLDVQIHEGVPFTKYSNPTPPLDIRPAQQELGYKLEFPMPVALADYGDWLRN